jgi:hypothetical protein
VVVGVTFTYWLITFAVAIFFSVILLLPWARKVKGEGLPKLKPKAKWLFFLYCVLIIVFLLMSAYSVIVGQRPFIWFLVFALIGSLALYFANSSTARHRKFSFVVVMLLAVLESSIPIIQNRGVLLNGDQWRDLKVTTYIVDEGTFQDAPGLGTGYYSFIPLFNVLNAVISEIAGWPAIATFTVLQFAISLLSAISIYIIMMKITHHVPVSLMAVMLYFSTPRLANVQVIPSTVGIALGLLLILLLVKENASSLRNILLIVAILAFTINVFHPAGIIPILVVCLGLVAISYLSSRERLAAPTISFAKRMFGLCLLITFAYWTVDSHVFAGVFNPLVRLVKIFTNPDVSSPSLYTPQYGSAGFELYSFAWALPVAFSAAYFISILRRRGGKPRLDRDLGRHVITVAAFAGLFAISTAFLSVLISPGGGLEKYINIPGYLLLILPSTFVFGQFLSSHKKAIVLFAVLLFSANVVIGPRSPDWAPFENPHFGAFRSTFTSFIEANDMVTYIPDNTRLYEDYDMPLDEVAQLRNITFETDRSYMTARNVIQIFKENSFKPFDPQYKDSVIVIKTDRIVDQRLLDNYVNIVYNTERHVTIVPL